MSETNEAPRRKRGRPKGARNAKTIVRAIAMEMHAVQMGERTVVMNTVQYVLHSLQVKVMKGDRVALQALQSLAARLGESDRAGVMIAPASVAEAAWIAAEEEKNKHRSPPPRREPEEH